jgi:hypothetical protein
MKYNYTRHVLAYEKEDAHPGLPLDASLTNVFDFEIYGLRLWVHGKQFPDETIGPDADWLRITAQYQAFGASVWTSGPIAWASHLSTFLDQLKAMNTELSGTATFDSVEPGLNISLEMTKLGHVLFEVAITPDHMRQQHSFKYQIDQTYLPAAISQLEKIVERFT